MLSAPNSLLSSQSYLFKSTYREAQKVIQYNAFICISAVQGFARWISECWTKVFNGFKRYWPYVWYLDKSKKHRITDIKKIGACDQILFLRMLLVPKNLIFEGVGGFSWLILEDVFKKIPHTGDKESLKPYLRSNFTPFISKSFQI